MSIAYLPSPVRGVWHFGLLPVRAYALCIVLGVVVAVWLASRRYRAAGGQAGVILDVAAWAVPAGLIGARLYSVLTDYQLYLGPHRDWTAIFRVWEGGIPGAIALGALGAWIACRRARVPIASVAGACAPAIAIGQAIGRVGNWFDQELYGRPSSLPWAVDISPAHRVPGYESFTTFQPAFLYEVIWDLLVAALVIWAGRRFPLTGDRLFALYVAAYSVGMFAIQAVRIDYSPYFWELRINQWVAILAFAAAAIYFYLARPTRAEDDNLLPAEPATTNPTP
jgi:prolipoprotein diacylglyceryl transferase